MAVRLREGEFFFLDDVGIPNDRFEFDDLPANLRGWSSLPAVLHEAVWVFADPWPLVMCLRQVCQRWNTLVGKFKPNEPTPQVAYTKGLWQDYEDRERDMKRAMAERVRATARATARARAKMERAKEREREEGRGTGIYLSRKLERQIERQRQRELGRNERKREREREREREM